MVFRDYNTKGGWVQGEEGEIAISPKIQAGSNDKPCPPSLRGACPVASKQSRIWDSQYALGTRDCHVGTKPVPPCNDGWGMCRLWEPSLRGPFLLSSLRGPRKWPVAISLLHSQRFCHCEGLPLPRHCEARSVSRSNLAFGFSNTPWVLEIATSPKMRAPRNDKWGTPTPWTTEIAMSGQNPSFLAMTVGGEWFLGTRDCFVRVKDALPRNDGWGMCRLLGTVIARPRFFSLRHCEHSVFSSFVIASLHFSPPSSLRGPERAVAISESHMHNYIFRKFLSISFSAPTTYFTSSSFIVV